MLSARKRCTRCQPIRCNHGTGSWLLKHSEQYRVAVVTKITSANATRSSRIPMGAAGRSRCSAPKPTTQPGSSSSLSGRGATHCCRTLSVLRPKSTMAIVRCNLFAAPGRLHCSCWHISLHLPLRILAAASSRSLAAATAYECLCTFSYWSLVYGFVDCG
jgi:hypothetical protein